MEKTKVSVIIPVYNAEKYIEKCLSSIMNQTLKEIEILIINDGSKDNSKVIVEKLSQEDNRIHFVSRENRGVGPTRNEALSMAKGEYVIFVDSDDTIDLTMCKKMYQKAKETDADIIICDKKVIKDEKVIEEKSNVRRERKVTISSAKEFLANYYYTGEFENHVWDKMFRLSIVKENNIQFGDLKEITGEDTFFEITILPYCKKAAFMKDKLYHYYIRENSIMTSYNPEKMQKTIRFIERVNEFQDDRGLQDEYNCFLATYLYNLAVASSREAIKHKKYRKLKENIHYMVENETVQNYAEILKENDALNLFQGTLKRKFAQKLAKWIIEKKEKKIYYLLLLKYYI